MPREPGIPLHLRGPSRGLIALVVIAFGCAMAYLGVMENWILAALLTFGLTITALVFFRTDWALLGLVVISNFDGFLKPLFPGPLTLLLKDYFVILGTVRWLWGLLIGESRPSIRTVVAVPALLLTVYVLGEIANPNSRGLMLSLAGARAWLIWLPVYFLTFDSLRSRRDIQRLWLVATAVSVLTGAYGIVQYFIGLEHLYRLSPDFAYYAKMGYWTEEGAKVTRVFSTMVHPGVFGTAMGFLALVATGLWFSGRTPAARLFALLSLPVIVMALFLSGTRAAMAGTALGLGVLVLVSRRPALLAFIGVALAAGFWQSFHLTEGALEKRVQSMTWEYTSQRSFGPLLHGLEVAWKHPFGRGVSSGTGVARLDTERGLSTKHERQEFFIENDFGRAFAELGVGAVFYFALLVAVGVGLVRAHRRLRDPRDQTLAAALSAGVVSVAVTLTLGSALYVAPGAVYFWLAAASAMRLPDIAEQEAAAQPQAEAA